MEDAPPGLPEAVTTAGLSAGATRSGAPTELGAARWDDDAGITGGVGARPPRDTGPLAVGEAFGPRYHIISLIGLGGMGAVYQAWDAELDVIVALKVIRPEVAADPEAARSLERRFKRELLLARQVTHSNVVRIHDLGEIAGVKYISMPFVEGADLSSILEKDGRLEVPRALRVARTALSGLVAAHGAGVVHRDLKPANLMITEGDNALIMDFGIARSTAGGDVKARAGGGNAPEAAARGGTTIGQIVGTIEYMAPEQARGEEADQRADIYAFGLILYDMLLGRRRHSRATTAVEELRGRMAQAPPSPRSVDPTIPEAVDAVVMRCLAPDAAGRFQTTTDLAEALARLDETGEPRPTDRRTIHAIVAIGLAVLVVMFAASWVLVRPTAPAPAHEPVPVIIADFENAVQEPVFDGTLERVLNAEVEEASFITSYSRQEAARTLQKIQAGTRLTLANSRLIAMREGIRFVLSGRIERDGAGYAVTLRAFTPADGRQTWGARATSKSRDGVLAAVGQLAVDLRKTLGDTPRANAGETVTATSLEAVREYELGQELANSGRHDEAIAHYRAAIQRDPRFGRAYSGWGTAAFFLHRNEEAAAQWKKALSLLDTMTEREKYRTLGTYYLGQAKNFEKAIENYQTLVRLYPTDLSAYNNLAYAYFSVLDFTRAREAGDKARRLFPKNAIIGNNFALYAMYAGDFAGSAAQARALVDQDPSWWKNYLPLAIAALATGNADGAVDAYRRMAATDTLGASLSSLGLADALIYLGRLDEAERELKRGIAADEKASNPDSAVMKWVALAEVYEATGRAPLALAAAKRVAEKTSDDGPLVLAARLYARLGRHNEALAVAGTLGRRLEPQSRALGKIVEAYDACQLGRWPEAIDGLRASVKLADLWLARFDMGVAYVKAGHEAEALPELDAATKRRGEATALFLDDVPSFRMLAPLPYWLGRAQEGVGQQAAARASYSAFLDAHGAAAADPLVVDARKRTR